MHIHRIDNHLAGIFEHHGNAPLHAGLDLSNTPIRAVRMADKHTGFKKFRFHCHGRLLFFGGAMNAPPRALNDLIGSRICHDLISPIGAISNGVELISMNTTTAGPELSLINDSVDGANAKIRYFRIAFGAAKPGQMVNRSEIVNILADTTRGSRLVIEWTPEMAQDRTQVKLALLLLMCFETALPWGGRVQVKAIGDQWAISAKADQIKIDPGLWRKLSDTGDQTPSEPANVQFALAGLFAQDLGRNLGVDVSANSVRVRF